jgi:hypothetical protein
MVSYSILIIMATVSMALAMASTGSNFSSIYEIEMDIHYADSAREELWKQQAIFEDKMKEARNRNDAVAAAEYGTMINEINLIRDRSNIVAISRQAYQRKEAFREHHWRKFLTSKAIDVTTWGLSKIGFGKVNDAYIRGKNWPAGSNFLTFNPLTGQKERIILGRPDLMVTQFGDDLSDFLTAILDGFDITSSAPPSTDILTAEQANTYVSEKLEQVRNVRPLPTEVGDYLAASIVKQIKRDFPQIAGEPLVEQAIFVHDHSCQRLRKMWMDEPNLDRSAVLRAALDKLKCDQLASAGTQPDSGPAKTQETKPIGPGWEFPADACAFMPSELTIKHRSSGLCTAEFSTDPYFAVEITLVEMDRYNRKPDLCALFLNNLQDQYLILNEMNLGDCGYTFKHSYSGKVSVTRYDLWGIRFHLNRVIVMVQTTDDYAADHHWIRDTASEIEQNILQYAP